MEKEDLLNDIIREYEKAYNEIKLGELMSIPVGRGLRKKTFFVPKTHNWGLTSGKTRGNGNKGETTTPYRLKKLASYGLFSEQDFHNYKGEKSLHKIIGSNEIDAKYIMQYLYHRVMNNKDIDNVENATEDEFDYGNEVNVLRIEGAKRIVEVNKYERNRKLRDECIQEHENKYECEICGFNFEKTYGDRGKGFIHIHHLQPLSEIGEKHLECTSKLIPVCPNCHAMLHRGKELMKPEELRKKIEENRKNN